MDISIFIARTLGLYLLIVSIGMLLNASQVRKILNELIDSPSLMLFSEILGLIFGILLVVSHNIWQPDWRVIITLMGWLTLIKTTICICSPKSSIKMTRYFAKHKTANKISGIITLFLGIYLCYFGF